MTRQIVERFKIRSVSDRLRLALYGNQASASLAEAMRRRDGCAWAGPHAD